MERLTIDEVIMREKRIHEENQKVVDTHVLHEEFTLEELYCDDTEVIEEHLSNYKFASEYHKQLAEWLEQLKSYKDAEEQGLLLRLNRTKIELLIVVMNTYKNDYPLSAILNQSAYKEFNDLLDRLYKSEEKQALAELEEEIRNKAIDEFAELMKERLKGMQMLELQGENLCPCNESGEDCPYMNQDIGCQYCAREQTIKDVEEIAEQLKGGAEKWED